MKVSKKVVVLKNFLKKVARILLFKIFLFLKFIKKGPPDKYSADAYERISTV